MRFDRAYCASPTCTPSRCSLYTGLYPFRHGAHPNHSWISEGVKTWPDYFREQGYRVVLAGKTHIGPREQFSFEYLPNSNVLPPDKREVLWTDLNTGAVAELLKSHDQTTPLCLIVASHSPHVYWDDESQYSAAEVDVPPYLIDTPELRSVRAKYYADVTKLDSQVGDVLNAMESHGYGDVLTIYTTDHGAQWPFAKWTLYDAGVRVPLIVRWRGKVSAGTSTSALVSLVDVLPTLLDATGENPAADDFDGRSFLQVLRGIATSHDAYVYSTNTGDGSMNRSPMRCVCDGRYKYILNLAPDVPFQTHIDAGDAVDGLTYWRSWEALAEAGDANARKRIERYRHRSAEELYDLSDDPYELTNRVDDPAQRATAARLREALAAWRDQQGDSPVVARPVRAGALPYAG